jgi:hypothetical protein
MGRASTSSEARSSALAARGLAPVRCTLANQRRNRSSLARLGISIPARASLPHSWSTWTRIASATSVGTPIG